MENFVISKAIGFVLAGAAIGAFSDRRALFWGAMLVVGAFTTYSNPIWGVVTFVELALGWFIGRWLRAISGGLKDRNRRFWWRVTRPFSRQPPKPRNALPPESSPLPALPPPTKRRG